MIARMGASYPGMPCASVSSLSNWEVKSISALKSSIPITVINSAFSAKWNAEFMTVGIINIIGLENLILRPHIL